ncbi:MAG: hypothetical protein RR614_00460 [Eubacterium sp.]
MTNDVKKTENKEVVQENSKSFDDITLSGCAFMNSREYRLAYKMAQTLQQSSMLPKRYQGNIGDCIIALDMASRLKANPLMVMQNLYVVNGMPAWSGQFVIAMINTSRRFAEPLQFALKGSGDTLSCQAYTKDQEGKVIKGAEITMTMAKKEGWYSKAGSKWQTMPEQMIQYRAASFFGRLYCSDLLMGIFTTDEASEIENAEYTVVDEKQIPTAVDQEIAQKANQQSITFSDVKTVELPKEQEPDMVEIFDQDEPTEAEKAAILAMEMGEMNEGPDF